MKNAIQQHTSKLVWQCLALFVATLALLAIFQSGSLVTLSYDLQPNAYNEQLVIGAEAWHEWMQVTGAAGVTETLRDHINTLQTKAVFAPQ